MGAWGKGILDDDAALDVYGDFFERYNEGADPRTLHRDLLRKYREYLSTDYSSVWLAIAQAQWECGCLATRVLREVRKIVATGSDLERWDDGGKKRRQRILDAFVSRLSKANPKPKSRVKHRARKTVFQPGTCLAVATYRGGYGAAIVLKVKPDRYDTFHLVGGLRGIHRGVPPLAVYEKRNWLRLTHGNFDRELRRRRP